MGGKFHIPESFTIFYAIFRELKPYDMYTGLLHTHSLLRYFILIALIVVIVKAILGLVSKLPYGKWDNKFSLYLFIFTHMQLLAGLILYFNSPFVKFGSETMSDKATRYWTVEHIFTMLIAVVLITLARTTSKRMTNDASKHKRMFIFNFVALILIVSMIWLSGRPLI
jgi:uncharacterized membrane protein